MCPGVARSLPWCTGRRKSDASVEYISKSEDSGETWVAQNPVTFASCIFGINALNSDTVFAVGCNATVYHGLILRSFDGGGNWDIKNISNTWGFYVIEFPSPTTGYTCGWNGRIYKTTDCGASWSSLATGSSQTFRRMSFLTENLGFAACGNDHASTNKIYKTMDGETWSLISNFGSSFIIGGMHFFDENTGVVVGTDGSKAAIKRTADGGESWIDVLDGNFGFVLESLVFEGDVGWSAGKYGNNSGIFKTLDAGESWFLDYDQLPQTPYGFANFDTTSYLVGTQGMILKNVEHVTQVGSIEKQVAPQVFPSPAKEKINIVFAQNTHILPFEIYNQMGQLMSAGYAHQADKIEIDVSSWPMGMYFIQSRNKEKTLRNSNKFLIN